MQQKKLRGVLILSLMLVSLLFISFGCAPPAEEGVSEEGAKEVEDLPVDIIEETEGGALAGQASKPGTKGTTRKYLSCSDSDGGEVKGTIGKVTYRYIGSAPRVFETTADRCTSGSVLKEYFCSGKVPGSKSITCSSAESCCDGACKVHSCGNSVVECGETCDFGDNNANDGCSASCRWEGSYWTFEKLSKNGKLLDQGDNKNDGTIISAVTGVDPNAARRLYSAYFDGTGDYVEVPPSPTLEVTNEITVSVWVKPEFRAGQAYVLISRLNSNWDGWELGYDADGGLYFEVDGYLGNGPEVVSLPNVLTNGVWQHVAATYKSNAAGKLYVNGFDVATTSTPKPIGVLEGSDDDLGVVFGARYNDKTRQFKGRMAHVAVYPVQVSEATVRKLASYLGWVPWRSCGNGAVDSGEQCDDGNAYGGDGCNSVCAFEGSVWKFNEGSGLAVADNSPFANNGEVIGTASWVTAGKYGKALSFDGTGDYVDIPDAATIDPTTTMAISLWLKPQFVAGESYVLVSKMDGDYDGWELVYNGNHQVGYGSSATINKVLYFDVDNNQQAIMTNGLTLNNGQWYHILATYKFETNSGTTGRGKIYVDGVDKTAVSESGEVDNTDSNLVIGSRSYDKTLPLKGVLDEVGLYSWELNEGQILDLYNAGTLS